MGEAIDHLSPIDLVLDTDVGNVGGPVKMRLP